jgi:hypothetical protein
LVIPFYLVELFGNEMLVSGGFIADIGLRTGVSTVKQSLYTPWRRLGGEEI